MHADLIERLEKAEKRERPSRHGAILGQALLALMEAGQAASTLDPSQRCATCAFRPGMTNQMAATGLQALHCTIGTDPDDFACHHGMKDGEPTKLCVGYLIARTAPWETVKAVIAGLNTGLNSVDGPDEIRAKFDAWISEVDPDGAIDDYARARLYLRALNTTQAKEPRQ